MESLNLPTACSDSQLSAYSIAVLRCPLGLLFRLLSEGARSANPGRHIVASRPIAEVQTRARRGSISDMDLLDLS